MGLSTTMRAILGWLVGAIHVMDDVIPMRLVAVICLLALAASRPSPSFATGAELYARYCLLCHGAHLEGYAADNTPSLVSPTFRATASDAFLRAAIERGRARTAMAGYGRAVGGPLGPADVVALVAYIRGGTTAPAPLARKPSTGSAATGREVYVANCQSCHGTAEQRATAVHLANAMFLATASDAYLRAAIVRGRPGTPMQGWGEVLSAREIEDVIAYVRSLARAVPPAPAPPAGVTADGQMRTIENVPVVVNPTGEQATFTLREDRYVSVADVAKAYDEKRRLVLIDARTPSDYLRMHITGAISIPYFNMHNLDNVPNDGTWVIAYCACPHHVSGVVMEELRKRGYPHTAVLDEGVFLWQQQGHPVVAAEGQLPIPAPPPNGAPVAMSNTVDDSLDPPPR
ncbi:MAG: c-type cytochrome [Deltaproteobacteria bacterium]|nr:c-type cytochrome [Deltaproteobacteria bacterium]